MKIIKKIDATSSLFESFLIYKIYFVRLCRFIISFKFSVKSFPSFFGANLILKNSRKFSFGPWFNVGDNVLIECFVKDKIIFGSNCTLKSDVKIIGLGVVSDFGKSLHVGNHVGISDSVLIYVRGSISIGDKTIIGPGVKIISENHIFSDPNIPIKDQGVSRKGIIIGENVWIGANSMILDGVSIGSGTVIAAGSVVNKSLPPNVVAGGVPVKILKRRKEE